MAFMTHLAIEEVEGDETRARLVTPLVYRVDAATTLIVPAGFETDLASIPQLCQFAIGKWEAHRAPAVVHDWLYTTGVVGRRRADWIFRTAMKARGVSRWKRLAMWAAVRVGGRTAWSRYRTETKSPVIERLAMTHLKRLLPALAASCLLIVLALGVRSISSPRASRPVAEPPRAMIAPSGDAAEFRASVARLDAHVAALSDVLKEMKELKAAPPPITTTTPAAVVSVETSPPTGRIAAGGVPDPRGVPLSSEPKKKQPPRLAVKAAVLPPDSAAQTVEDAATVLITTAQDVARRARDSARQAYAADAWKGRVQAGDDR